MNKLYLLSALVACAYSVDTTESDECTVVFGALEDADYPYGWLAAVEFGTVVVGATESGDDISGTACYYDYTYDFTIDAVEKLDADGADSVTDVDAEYYLYLEAATGDAEAPTFADPMTMAEAYDAAVAETDNIDEGDEVSTLSDDGDDDTAPGYTVYFVWLGTADILTVSGYSNNAVVSAASAFTVAAVAGLFF